MDDRKTANRPSVFPNSEIPSHGISPSLALSFGAAAAIFRFKVGMIPTLVACCAAGGTLHLAHLI